MKRAALALVAALAVPAGLAAQTTVDQKRPAAPDGAVSIENMSGSIKVTGWDRAVVQVRGTVADNAELELTGTDRKIHVEVSPQGNPMAKSDIEVTVPAGEVMVGEFILVKPGDKIPLDGLVAAGISAGAAGSETTLRLKPGRGATICLGFHCAPSFGATP